MGTGMESITGGIMDTNLLEAAKHARLGRGFVIQQNKEPNRKSKKNALTFILQHENMCSITDILPSFRNCAAHTSSSSLWSSWSSSSSSPTCESLKPKDGPSMKSSRDSPPNPLPRRCLTPWSSGQTPRPCPPHNFPWWIYLQRISNKIGWYGGKINCSFFL